MAAVPFSEGPVAGFLHRPKNEPSGGLVLTHGAGGNCESPLLNTVAEAFAELGIAVLRYDLPFRQRRRTGPPFPALAGADRAGLQEAVVALRRLAGAKIFLGGHSYGGRQASMLAAEQPDLVSGLLLLSYPLHPPGKPEQLRTAHFAALRTKALFVHGTKDPFGSIEELRQATESIPVKTVLIDIDGAGHDLKRGKFQAADAAKLFLGLTC